MSEHSPQELAARRFKRFLFSLPKNSQFQFTNKTKKQIRKELLLSCSDDGKYLDWIFPKIFNDEPSDEAAHQVLENDLNWNLPAYSKYCLQDCHADIHNHDAYHPRSVCARIFRKGEPIYRCLTCGFDDTCAMCSSCYQEDYHRGHKVHITICVRDSGGVCDCGDPEAWINDVPCIYRVREDGSRYNQSPPPDFLQAFSSTLASCLDFVVDTMCHADLHYENPNETTTTRIELNSINSTLDPLKYGFSDSNMVDSASEKFYLMVYNDQIRHYRDAVQRIHLVSRKVKQFATMVTDKVQSYGKGRVISSKNLNLLIERQKILSSTGLASCIRNHRDTFREDMCDEILQWIHDFAQSELFKTNNDLKNIFCTVFTSRWDSGLLKSRKFDEPYEYKVGTLDNLRIPKVPSDLAQFSSLNTSTVNVQSPGDSSRSPNSLPSLESGPTSQIWKFKPSLWELDPEICQQCNYNLNLEDYNPLKSHIGSRFQYLIYLDIRFWKSIRALIHDMYASSLITNLKYKHIISCQYVDIYPAMAHMFLSMDHEPEYNVMCTLSTQLFTCPSTSSSIVDHGDLVRIYASIYGFLTSDEVKSPNTLQLTNQIMMISLKNRKWGQIVFDIGYILSFTKDSSLILTSGIIPMSCDILALFQGKSSVKREKESHIEFENSDYTSFFHAILVVYHFGESISRCLSVLKDKDAKKDLGKNAIIYVIKYLLKLEKSGTLEDSTTGLRRPELVGDDSALNHSDLSKTSAKDARILKEHIGGNIIQDFRIDEERVSFLHPLHSLLSWLIEMSNFDSLEELTEILKYATSSSAECTRSRIASGELPNPMATIFDYPIRTIVLMSQIKSGFWVRNGFSIRNQLQLYRNSGLRENGYMRDLFLTQVFINTNTPNLTCFMIFSRWLLMDGWIVDDKHYQSHHTHNNSPESNQRLEETFDAPTIVESTAFFNTYSPSVDDNTSNASQQSSQPGSQQVSQTSTNQSNENTAVETVNQPVYDSKTLPYILEECINFFIHVISEDLFLQNLDGKLIKEIRIRNEIIHNLCFEPMNYTKLCLQIPDHITNDKSFDLLLESCSELQLPKSSNDVGLYRLKEEFYEEINPYYFNYTTNTKDDAIKFIKQRVHSQTKKPIEDIVIEPKLSDPEKLGIYKYIGNFSVSSYYSDFLIKTLKYIIKEGLNKLENLLETTLHLIHICSKEQFIDAAKYGTFYDRFVNISDYYGCSIAVILYEMLTDENFKSHHAKVRSIFKVFEEKYQNLGEILKDQVSDFDYVLLDLNVCSNNDESDKEKRREIAKARKLKLLAKIKKQQSSFLKNFNFDSDIEMEENPTDKDVDESDGNDAHDHGGWKFPEAHCLLCQNTSEDAGPFGIITYITKSSEFRSVPFDDKYWLLKSFSDKANLNADEYENEDNMDMDEKSSETTQKYREFMAKVKNDNVLGPGFANPKYFDSKIVSSSCGHGMHFQCYMNFLTSNSNKPNQITRNTPENIDHKEFLCPLCKSVNNMFIPVLWSTNNRKIKDFLTATELSHSSKSNPYWTLSSSQLYSGQFYEKFVEATDHDIEQYCILDAESQDMIAPKAATEITIKQQQFRILLSNMFQTFSFFSFPLVFKADSTYLLVNTIKSVEISIRGLSSGSSLLLSQISNSSLTNLRILSEFRNTNVLMKIKDWIHLPSRKGDAYTKMLASLMSLTRDNLNTTIMEADLFELLVTIMPTKSLGFSFNATVATCFMAHLLQNINILAQELNSNGFFTSTDLSVLDLPKITGLDRKACTQMVQIFRMFVADTELPDDPRLGEVLLSALIKASTPFLRRTAIYAYVQCGGIDLEEFEDSDLNELEANRLCSFLNIDSIFACIEKFLSNDQSYESDVLHDFLAYKETPSYSEVTVAKKQMEYPGIIKLIDLPERLDYFFTKYYYSDKFNNPHVSIEDPAVCLFCGQMVDAQKAAVGCVEGQCTTHYTKECANEIGIFLLPKDRCLLLLHKNGGSFQNPPYLDAHGELPVENKKANPLYFMRPRYDDFIRTAWLQHNISNLIVRNLDSVLDAGGWDTL